MDTRIVAVCCLWDDMLKVLHYKDDVQSQMTAAEVMTTAIIAALDDDHREGLTGRVFPHARWL
jgi:hypothetical protein